MYSIKTRLIIAFIIIFVSALTIFGFALDRAFQSSTLEELKQRIESHIYTIISTTEESDSTRITVNTARTPPRFIQPNSGLYAIYVQNGTIAWQSESVSTGTLPVQSDAPIAKKIFSTQFKNGRRYFVYAYGVSFESTRLNDAFTLNIIESSEGFDEVVRQFRQRLFYWLLGTAGVLTFVLWLLLKWSMKPLNDAADEITQIETGAQSIMIKRYPVELHRLTQNINVLINSSQARIERYRNALGNLAHSLKTPLAILQNSIDDNKHSAQDNGVINEQVTKIKEIVDYQLQRASTIGQTPFAKRVIINEVVTKIVRSLDKVYREKTVNTVIKISANLSATIDESDLMEILGNLLDNSYKWCNGTVQISASKNDERVLKITVDDDGPGIDHALTQSVLQRGVRALSEKGGSGIGLAIVADIAKTYNGELSLEASELGGLRACISLPTRYLL